MSCRTTIPAAFLVVSAPFAAFAVPVLPDFSSATFAPGAAIDNPWFPLGPETRSVLDASAIIDGEAVSERTELTFGGTGPELLGVATTIQRDRAFEQGVIVEDTFDYYAQDVAGNVWYFGEDVTNYRYDEDGALLGTDTPRPGAPARTAHCRAISCRRISSSDSSITRNSRRRTTRWTWRRSTRSI